MCLRTLQASRHNQLGQFYLVAGEVLWLLKVMFMFGRRRQPWRGKNFCLMLRAYPYSSCQGDELGNTRVGKMFLWRRTAQSRGMSNKSQPNRKLVDPLGLLNYLLDWQDFLMEPSRRMIISLAAALAWQGGKTK